jgi:hypothetical protein
MMISNQGWYQKTVSTVVLLLLLSCCTERVESTEDGPKYLAQTSAGATAANETDIERLKRALSSSNLGAVVEETNRVLGSRSSHLQSLHYLRKVWEWDTEQTKDLPKEFLQQDAVRALIANVLAQGLANHDIELDSASLLSALRAGLDVPDPHVIRASLRGIAPLSQDRDVDKIAVIAESADPANARTALGTLSVICGDYAKKAIDQLAANSTSKIARLEALETYNSMTEIRKIRCGATAK